MKSLTVTRYVTPLREGGSLPALIEADDDGMYVVKFRGAGQGTASLVAEVVVGELGRRLGVRVPELVVLDLDPRIAPRETSGTPPRRAAPRPRRFAALSPPRAGTHRPRSTPSLAVPAPSPPAQGTARASRR